VIRVVLPDPKPNPGPNPEPPQQKPPQQGPSPADPNQPPVDLGNPADPNKPVDPAAKAAADAAVKDALSARTNRAVSDALVNRSAADAKTANDTAAYTSGVVVVRQGEVGKYGQEVIAQQQEYERLLTVADKLPLGQPDAFQKAMRDAEKAKTELERRQGVLESVKRDLERARQLDAAAQRDATEANKRAKADKEASDKAGADYNEKVAKARQLDKAAGIADPPGVAVRVIGKAKPN
jgi:hypothetical protein